MKRDYRFYWRCINCDERSEEETKKCCDTPMRVKTVGLGGKDTLKSLNNFLNDQLDLVKARGVIKK